jgi:rare lipoprotein A
MFMLTACQQTPVEPGMKLGKPYSVDGKMYYPEYEPSYDKTGEASWYGPGFHGKYTASGEVFNQNDLTAAHPTLPMPCLVRVTNLNNDKTLIVRINDRGPFKGHRIIDLSKASAKKLGITSTARVRVQFLQKETEEYLASINDGGPYVIDMVAYNKEAATPQPSQIVENNDASTHTGDTVADAAPVMTVESSELVVPEGKSAGRVYERKSAGSSGGLIKAAWADDTVTTTPSPDREDVSGFEPPLSKSDAEPRAMKTEQAHQEHASVLTQGVSGSYIVQAGSFAAEQNARKLASKLEGMSSLTVDRIDIGSRSWWRVRLGPFEDKEAANDALEQVRAAGVNDAKIIHL